MVLDAGHGGRDPGNIGNGYREKVIALKVVKKIGAELAKRKDIKIVYTRTTDVSNRFMEKRRNRQQSQSRFICLCSLQFS